MCKACFRLYLHVFHPIPVLGGGGGGPKGLVHNLLRQGFTLDSSKIEVIEIYFFYNATTHNDHPRYVKHVSGRIYVFFTLFGYYLGVGGGGSKRWAHNLLMQSPPPPAAQKSKFPKFIF